MFLQIVFVLSLCLANCHLANCIHFYIVILANYIHVVHYALTNCIRLVHFALANHIHLVHYSLTNCIHASLFFLYHWAIQYGLIIPGLTLSFRNSAAMRVHLEGLSSNDVNLRFNAFHCVFPHASYVSF